MASQTELKRRLQVLMKRPENMVCSDCPERQPRWASLIVPPPGSPQGALPIGAFCCLECSGSHRRLGVHISFVRSVNLDQWKEREVLAMEQGGNAKVNSIFEARMHGNEKPVAMADGRTRERFIRDKYERRKYFDPNALQQFYSFESTDEEDDEEEEEEEDEPTRRPAAPKIRAPSDAARKRAEKRRSRQASGGQERQDKPPKPAADATPVEAASSSEPVMDLLDFGSMPAQSDPGPPPAPPSAPVTPLAVVRETSSEQSVSVVGNTHDPFAVTAKAKSIEVSVKTVSTGGAATSASATNGSSVGGGDQKQKPKLNSDDIMKMFNAPPQQMGGMMGMGGMNPAAMGMNMNGNNMAMMNPMGGAPMGGMAQFGGAAAPMAGNGNFMMPQQQQPNNPTGMMPQQQYNGGNYMMQQANGNNMGMGTMQQSLNTNTNNNMMNMQQMQQQANMNMMMMQQQMQQIQITQGKNTAQQTWSSKTTEQVSSMQQQPNGNPSGMNAMNHIAMMNRLQMGNSPNMNMMGMATTAGGGTQQQEKHQQGQQQQMNQFASMNGFGS